MPWNLAVKKIRAALGLLTVMLLVKPSGWPISTMLVPSRQCTIQLALYCQTNYTY
jgi:hypothetical protein